jgi:hypothetical protein
MRGTPTREYGLACRTAAPGPLEQVVERASDQRLEALNAFPRGRRRRWRLCRLIGRRRGRIVWTSDYGRVRVAYQDVAVYLTPDTRPCRRLGSAAISNPAGSLPLGFRLGKPVINNSYLSVL